MQLLSRPGLTTSGKLTHTTNDISVYTQIDWFALCGTGTFKAALGRGTADAFAARGNHGLSTTAQDTAEFLA